MIAATSRPGTLRRSSRGFIAIGPSPRGRGAQFADGSFTVTLARETPCTLVLLHPESELDDAGVVQQTA
jgi:hypothetical protein